MKIIVSTHKGELYNEEIDYAVIHNQDGEFAILENRIPIISVITSGYIKIVRDKTEYFIVVINGVLEYHNNFINVITAEAHIGETASKALDYLNSIRQERLEANKKYNVDNTKMERDLADNLKKSRAGHL